ncbi:mutS protein homolog 4 [Aspergillus udagawae]|nr:mutS protein homolog 4 [Aspergillus udagawae]
MTRSLSRVSSFGEARSFTALTSRQDSDRPRTARPATTATSIASQDIICAITETVLCQICDSQTYAKTVTKIAVLEPTEILFMSSAKGSKLFYIIQENIPDTTYTFLDRRYWSEKVGHEYVDRLAFPQDVETIKITLGGNYFASCCLAAVLKYIELERDRVFTSHSLRIRFEPSQGSMSIDLSTIASLELIQNLQYAKSKDSLFGLLNETLTPMGARLLRANILQPCSENSKLLARYDAVEDLSTKEDMFISVRQALKGFIDADKALTSLILAPTKRTFQYVEQSVNNVIMLKTYVSSIKSIYKALATAQSSLLMTIRELCAPACHRAIEQLVEETLNEHVTYQTKPLDLRNQRIYCVRAGVNSLLDVARQTYKEANVDAADLVAKLSGALHYFCSPVVDTDAYPFPESHNLNLDLKFDSARQYYISVSASEVETLPEIFINIYRRKNRIECQTLNLVKLNQKIIDAHNEVVNMSDQTIQSLINDVCSEISVLFKVSEAIAMLDMLASFAELATCNEYIRPELTDVLAIKSGRHPIREKIHTKKFIPNDAYATQQSRFQIITGSNMSGKSTYIRSLALMTIMAQIGCFIPAEYASFPVIRQLFARVSTSDDLEANVSTFAAEMREMAFILRNIEPRSMVIVDELGRGTSTTDGLAIAIAIAEALIESRAHVWFVTHFRDLALILAERSGVVSLHLAAEISPDISRMVMLYKIAEGPDTTQFYGLAVAKLVDLPPGVLESAQAVSEKLNKIAQRRHSKSKALMLSRKRNLLLSLREQLLQARNGTLEGDALRQWLKKLQDNFVLRMAAVEEETAEMSDDEVDNDPDTVPAETAQDTSEHPSSQERAEGASGDEPQTAILISSASRESVIDSSSREMSRDETPAD